LCKKLSNATIVTVLSDKASPIWWWN